MKDKKKFTKEDKKYEKLVKQAEENLAGWQRATADYENLKKECEKNRIEYVSYANANLIMELLPVYDNFKAAFNCVPEKERNNAWLVGFEHIKSQIKALLDANGVEEIATDGEKFDPEFHEAVESEKVIGKKEGIILRTVKSGYKLHGKVIQAAKVVVNNISC